MATQTQLELHAAPHSASTNQNKSDGGGAAPPEPETDLAWELVKEECHDILEQLPLTLQRNFSLMRDLDEQVAAHLRAIPSVLRNYMDLRTKLEQDVVMAEADGNEFPKGRADDGHSRQTIQQRAASRAASFSSASLTPITESPPSTDSLSPRQIHEESPIEEDEEEDDGSNDPQTSFGTPLPLRPEPKSTELLSRVATLATDAVRGSLEKVNLSNAAFAAIERHIRALDIAIAEQESVVATGMRTGARTGGSTLSNGVASSPIQPSTHRPSQSFESNNLLALAEVASAVHAAEKTLENIQPPSAVSTTLTPIEEKAESKQIEKPADKLPDKPQPKGKADTRASSNKPKQDPLPSMEKKPTERKVIEKRVTEKRVTEKKVVEKKAPEKKPVKKKPTGKQDPIAEEEEPRYCYCDRVSFGKMIACDGPKCKREWFHWSCVGITREPTANKWYCRDCEVEEPAAKKRRKR